MATYVASAGTGVTAAFIRGYAALVPPPGTSTAAEPRPLVGLLHPPGRRGTRATS